MIWPEMIPLNGYSKTLVGLGVVLDDSVPFGEVRVNSMTVAELENRGPVTVTKLDGNKD
jgi:hypothetical protein